MEFILRGTNYSLLKQDVENKMKGIIPEQINQYFIEVNGKKYPPKQVLAESLGIGRVEFTTMDASSILRRLGYKLSRLTK